MPSARSVCGIRAPVVLIAVIFIITAGCSAPEQPSGSAPASQVVTTTLLPGTPALTTAAVTTSLVPTIVPVTPTITITKTPENTKVATTTLVPAPTLISDSALNARIVDARNKLEMFIDSDVADTVIIHTGPPPRTAR
ncbi:MAG TPA: hypothetical protein VHN82_07530 [Methanoregula sp.]|nr:hypothetical protein [Methanoregula sp.]